MGQLQNLAPTSKFRSKHDCFLGISALLFTHLLIIQAKIFASISYRFIINKKKFYKKFKAYKGLRH